MEILFLRSNSAKIVKFSVLYREWQVLVGMPHAGITYPPGICRLSLIATIGETSSVPASGSQQDDTGATKLTQMQASRKPRVTFTPFC